MDLGFNNTILKIEIFIAIICLFYAAYYFISRMYYLINYFRGVIKPQRNKSFKDTKEKDLNKVFSQKEYKEEVKKLDDKEKSEIRDLLKRIRLNRARGEFEIARNLIIEALTIDKINKEVNLELASLYIYENDFVKAEYIYKDLLLIHDDDFEILKKLGLTLSSQEKYEIALEVYKKSYNINKNDLEVIHMIANLSYVKWDYIESVRYFKKYIKERPRDVDNLISLAEVYKKMWNFSESVLTLKRALDINPYNEYIHKELKELETPEMVKTLEN